MVRKTAGADHQTAELPLAPWRGRDALFVFLLTLLATFILGALEVPHLPVIITAVWGLLTLFRARRYGSTWLLFGPSFRCDLRTLAFGLLSGLISLGFVAGIPLLVILVTGLDPSGATRDPLGNYPLSEASWALVVGTVLLGPLVEELFFRGLLLQGLRRSYGKRAALNTSAILFGLGHIQDQFVWTVLSVGTGILVGLFFGWLFIRSRNLAQPIVAHSILNAGLLLLWLVGS